jgi:hypothetical protein
LGEDGESRPPTPLDESPAKWLQLNGMAAFALIAATFILGLLVLIVYPPIALSIRGQLTNGTVTAADFHRQPPVVRVLAGPPISHEVDLGGLGSLDAQPVVGETVTLRYDPANLNRVWDARAGMPWGSVLVLGVNFLLFVSVAFVLATRPRWARLLISLNPNTSPSGQGGRSIDDPAS